MTKNLFKKAVAFGDIHFGKSSNSEEYNKKAAAFVDWFIEEGKAYGADTCIFLGDWHDSRISVHVKTLNYSLEAMEKLSNAFENFHFIPGNHDIYHRTRRDYNSIEFARNITNINIANEPTTVGNVALVPWLIGDEWKDVRKMKCKYMFGHFELPHFLMNAKVAMPDHGGLVADDLVGPDMLFSGHFHKRQNQNNIWYIGNAFPQNYSDTDDDERGMMFLEWGKEPEFKAWPDQPIYRQYNLSELLAEPANYIYKNVHARVNVDIDMSYEEAQVLKDGLVSGFDASDIKFIQKTSEVEEAEWEQDVEFMSVDQIVVDGLNSLDNETAFEKKLLIDIYNDLNVGD